MTVRVCLLLTLSLCISWSLLVLGAGSPPSQDLAAAQKAFQAKEYDKVIELLGSHVETLKRDGLFILAQSYSAKKNQVSAIKLYEAALSLNPKDSDAKRLLGVEYMTLGRDNEAKANMREAIELDPSNENAYIDMAHFYEKKKNKYELRLLFEDLIKNPKVGRKPPYITRLCELTTLEGQYTLSKAYCNEGLMLNSKDPKNRIYLAMTMKETGDLEGAEKNFRDAADGSSKSEFAQVSAATFYVGQKNFLKSYHYFKRATETAPTSMESLLGLASSSLEIQKYEDAWTALRKACDLNRSAFPQVRRAISSLRQQKNKAWQTKFEALSENCNGPISNP